MAGDAYQVIEKFWKNQDSGDLGFYYFFLLGFVGIVSDFLGLFWISLDFLGSLKSGIPEIWDS